MPRASKKALQGQLDLIGGVVDLKLTYIPHKEISEQGEAVVVLRIPESFIEIDKVKSIEAMKALAGISRTVPNKYFYLKRPRR